ncbi:hypothetical protein SDRG_00303 [Saprolegnia diclina VS20]|uniref:Uncharacterized protein n=1 Tax=Saprolegnia diclina (strain VS20) TaxID=1156394 RepID=T0SB23_SAPDV|nr:hypothetical protein SDRG_00303 [Saprolegnia diclina VS20]EQC42573.1 hypothetical protein SDRG_00303 [Saprolegnia diclina VS20]|eukprot:XP_008603996.1 hypothetical protein SDRG_00303 [Saprolegnia diclina VS20]
MAKDATKTKRPARGAAQDASTEPRAKKAKTVKTNKSSTPAPAAAQAVPAAAEAATTCQAAELKALLARLRKPNGLVLSDRALRDACIKLGIDHDGAKLAKLKRIRKCIKKVTAALEDDFIHERIAQDAATLKKPRSGKKQAVKAATQVVDERKKPLPEAQPTQGKTGASTTTSAGQSAWFPTQGHVIDMNNPETLGVLLRRQRNFCDDDVITSRGVLCELPDFRAGFGPLADLRRTTLDVKPTQIPGPPHVESEGIILRSPSHQT